MTIKRKKQLIILFVTLFMVTVGFGIILPIMPFFAQNLGATATDLGIIFALFALMQFLSAPYWGKMSDKYGRRPIFLVGLIGFGASFVMIAVAQSLLALYLSRIFGGLLSAAVLPAAMAYVADSTDSERRAAWMGYMGAAMNLGLIFGPAFGGFLGEVNPTTPFWAASFVIFLVAIFAFLFLPESKTKTDGELEGQFQPAKELLNIFESLKSPERKIYILGFFVNIALTVLFAISALYVSQKFGFSESEVALFFVAFAIFGAFGQGLVAAKLIKLWGEVYVTLTGLILAAFGFFVLLLAYDFFSLLALSAFLGLGSALIGPSITSLLSKRTSEEHQGHTMGVFNAYQSLGRVIGPIMGGAIFDKVGIEYPFVFSGIVLVLLSIFWGYSRNQFSSSSIDAAD
jgi:multidrug resistance protein